MLQIIKTQTVELVVPTGSTLLRFQFDTQNFLRQKKIVFIECFSVNDFATSPQGNILPTKANLSNAYLTLYGDNPESPGAFGNWMQSIPMWSMHRMNNGVDPYVFDPFNMVPRNITWEKSYITVNAALGNGSQLSFLFNVGYSGNEGDN